MIRKTNNITIGVKEGSIFKEANIKLATMIVRNLLIENDVLTFESRISIKDGDERGQIVKAEILEDEISMLVVDDIILFPIFKEEKEDVNF